MVPPVITAVPFGGVLTEATVSVSPTSGATLSLPSTFTEVGDEFWSTVIASSTAVGGSFTLVTVTETTALSVPPFPSLIAYVKLSVPLKFAFGV